MLESQQAQESRQLGVRPVARLGELVGRIAAPGVDQRDPAGRRRPLGRRQCIGDAGALVEILVGQPGYPASASA